MGELYFGCICCTSSIVGNDPGCIVQRNPFFLLVNDPVNQVFLDRWFTSREEPLERKSMLLSSVVCIEERVFGYTLICSFLDRWLHQGKGPLEKR